MRDNWTNLAYSNHCVAAFFLVTLHCTLSAVNTLHSNHTLVSLIHFRAGVSNTRPANSCSAARIKFKIQKLLNISTKKIGLFIVFDNKYGPQRHFLPICSLRNIFFEEMWPSSGFWVWDPCLRVWMSKMVSKDYFVFSD
jgi:hypothetical protein